MLSHYGINGGSRVPVDLVEDSLCLNRNVQIPYWESPPVPVGFKIGLFTENWDCSNLFRKCVVDLEIWVAILAHFLVVLCSTILEDKLRNENDPKVKMTSIKDTIPKLKTIPM